MPSRVSALYARLAAGLIFGLLTALSLGPLGGMLLMTLWSMINKVHLSFGLLLGSMLLIGVVLGTLVGSLNGLLYTHDKERRFWGRIGRCVAQGVLNGLLIGLLLGCPYGVIGYLIVHDWTSIAWQGFIIGLLSGFVFVLIDALLGIPMADIRPAETFVWSWARMGWNLMKFVCFGLLGSLLIGLLFGLFNGSYEWIVNKPESMMHILQAIMQLGLQVALVFAPFFVVIGGLLGGLAGGLSSEILDTQHLTTPNQGIRRSGRRGLLVGAVSGLLGAVMSGVLGSAVAGNPQYLWPFILTYGMLFGSLLGLVSGLRAGGIACIQHVALRFLLRKAGAMPWNYPRFLNYAAERILLRKVGGGYIFTHRILLEYMATLNSATVPLSQEGLKLAGS